MRERITERYGALPTKTSSQAVSWIWSGNQIQKTDTWIYVSNLPHWAVETSLWQSMELGVWFMWGNAGTRPLLSWIPPNSGRWDTAHLVYTEHTAAAWKHTPGKDALIAGIRSPVSALFLQFNERGGLDPPAKAGAAEPSGEPERLSVCRQAASSPLWGVGEHIRYYLGSQNGTQGCAIKKQHLSVKIILQPLLSSSDK